MTVPKLEPHNCTAKSYFLLRLGERWLIRLRIRSFVTGAGRVADGATVAAATAAARPRDSGQTVATRAVIVTATVAATRYGAYFLVCDQPPSALVVALQ